MTADRRRPTLLTRVGRAEWGENRFRGYAVLGELRGESWWSLLSLSVGGRRLTREAAGVLDDVARAFLAADPRIWPLKAIRLLSSYGSQDVALGGAYVFFEGARVGPAAVGRSAHLLWWLREQGAGEGSAVTRDLLARRSELGERIDGFGVAARPFDERLQALACDLEARGRTTGAFWTILRHAEQAMRELRGLPANIALGVAAACLDLGFSPDQVQGLACVIALPPLLANAFEGARQVPELLRVLPLEHVHYAGPTRRQSPRAQSPSPEEGTHLPTLLVQ
jgi:hypothetical protein